MEIIYNVGQIIKVKEKENPTFGLLYSTAYLNGALDNENKQRKNKNSHSINREEWNTGKLI